MQADLTGKIIIITGAGSGIGAATALLAAESGVEGLVLSDSDGPALARIADAIGKKTRLGLNIADLADPQSPSKIAYSATGVFGRIDGLVNAAQALPMGGEDTTLEGWEQMFTINARAPFFLMQEAVADMKRRGKSGSIVNIQSSPADSGAPEMGIHAASVAAMQALTRNIAEAYKEDNIRVNGFNPGLVPDGSEEQAARQVVHLLSDASAPMTGEIVEAESAQGSD